MSGDLDPYFKTMSGDSQLSNTMRNLNGKIMTITGYRQSEDETREQLKIKLEKYFEQYGPIRKINMFSWFTIIEYWSLRDAEDECKNI